MKEVILILGGTREAAELAAKLVKQSPDTRVISSLAGRTKEPKPLDGEVRVGGFGGTEGLIKYIEDNNITRLIDATHPFAKIISSNAKRAIERTGIDFDLYQRAPWQEQTGDNWLKVRDLDGACNAIPSGARALLALGSQHINVFSNRTDVHFLVRMVDDPKAELPFAHYTIELGKPGDVAQETKLLKQHKITHIVCRNSGGQGAYAKIVAARALGMPVIIVENT